MKTEYKFDTDDIKRLIEELPILVAAKAIDLNGIPEGTAWDRLIELMRSVRPEKVGYSYINISLTQ